MPFTLTMPKLSPTMEAGTITKWRKKEGDFVKAGDVLFEVATDKATVEHSALDEGTLRKIIVGEGGDAVVGQAVAIFTEKAEESIEGYKPEGVETKAVPPPPAEKEKERPSPTATKPTPGAMQQPTFTPEPPLTKYTFAFPSGTQGTRPPASPFARKIAREKGIDLTSIKGSGPGGRIMSRDIPLGQAASLVSFGEHGTPDTIPGTYEEIPLTPMRKIIGQRLQEAKTFIPHFYVSQEIRADGLTETREQLKRGGIKVSFNDLLVRATALALREHPAINSGFNSANTTIIRFKTIDIAIAVSIEGGLITPIIRHADYKNLGQISVEMKSLIERARKGKLAREEYAGGSFTISNLGMYAISNFVAVINPPQAAILAIAGIEEKPVVKEGQIVPGKTMLLTLSADHRVIDGADAAKFLKTLQKLAENPSLLLL